MFEDPVNGFWNLECADITHQNGKYFMTYSAQPEDTVWYTVSDEKFSGYGAPKRLEGKHFYAPKIVEGDAGTFLVGWVYRATRFRTIPNSIGAVTSWRIKWCLTPTTRSL